MIHELITLLVWLRRLQLNVVLSAVYALDFSVMKRTLEIRQVGFPLSTSAHTSLDRRHVPLYPDSKPTLALAQGDNTLIPVILK